MNDRIASRSATPLLTSLLIGLPVLYVASFGPGCWISYGYYERWRTVNSVFRPLLASTRWCEPARRGLERYANLFAPDGSRGFIHDGVAAGD